MDMLKQDEFLESSPNRVSPEFTQTPETKTDRQKLIIKIAFPLCIILLGVAAVALISLLDQPPEKKADAVTLPGVNTVVVESETITFKVYSQGTVVPQTEIPLITEVSGLVTNVSAKLQVGGFFQSGEVLLTIDDSDYAATVKQAEANLLGKRAQLTQEIAQSEQAKKEWRLTGRPINEAPILALREPFLEKAKAEVLHAEAELAQAQRKLERTRIRAPFNGLLKTKNIGLGQYVSAGTSLADVIGIDAVEVRLPLSSEEIAFINLPRPQTSINEEFGTTGIGPSVTLSANVNGKEYQWPGKISRAEGIIDSRSRVHYVIAQIENPYGIDSTLDNSLPVLPVGSFVRAEIEGITLNNIIAVPRDAFRDEKTLMLIDQENRLRFRDTEVVRSDNKFIYVSAGLDSGEEVITTVLPAPVDGMLVRKIAAL